MWIVVAFRSILILPPPTQVIWVINKMTMECLDLRQFQRIMSAAYPWWSVNEERGRNWPKMTFPSGWNSFSVFSVPRPLHTAAGMHRSSCLEYGAKQLQPLLSYLWIRTPFSRDGGGEFFNPLIHLNWMYLVKIFNLPSRRLIAPAFYICYG